jgi:hypothetical protein
VRSGSDDALSVSGGPDVGMEREVKWTKRVNVKRVKRVSEESELQNAMKVKRMRSKRVKRVK